MNICRRSQKKLRARRNFIARAHKRNFEGSQNDSQASGNHDNDIRAKQKAQEERQTPYSCAFRYRNNVFMALWEIQHSPVGKTVCNGASMRQNMAYLILNTPAYRTSQNTVADYGEGHQMAIRGIAISRQGTHAFQRSRLGRNTAFGFAVLHSVGQGSIHTRHRQRRIKVFINSVAIPICIAQQCCFYTCRSVIIEGHTTSIGNLA